MWWRKGQVDLFGRSVCWFEMFCTFACGYLGYGEECNVVLKYKHTLWQNTSTGWSLENCGLISTARSIKRHIITACHRCGTNIIIPNLFLPHFLCPSGEIINWVALDHEKQAHHQLTVLVTDHGSPRLNATAIVYISVMDINDNKPIFTQVAPGKELSAKVCSSPCPACAA